MNDSNPQNQGGEQDGSYMSAPEAAAYERRAKAIGIGIFLAVLFGGAILFDMGADSWSPQQRESMFVPRAPSSSGDAPAPDNAAGAAGRADTLLLAQPRNAYDLPATDESSEGWLRVTTGEVKAFAPRRDRMNDGSTRKNLYARTEYFMPDKRADCYFHQYMGLAPVYTIGQRVRIQYDPTADDPCGTSRIVK